MLKFNLAKVLPEMRFQEQEKVEKDDNIYLACVMIEFTLAENNFCEMYLSVGRFFFFSRSVLDR